MTVLDYAVKAKERLDFEFPYDLKEWTENMNMLMENYHKHTTWSDLVQIDSATSMEEFIEYSKKMGCRNYFSGEHGYQGEWLAAYDLCTQMGVKFRYSVEAYWVKDINSITTEEYTDKKGNKKTREKKDNMNCHMVIVARNYKAMRKLNYMISVAHQEGFYYKPRIDLNMLFELDKDDIYITSACFLKGTQVLTDKGYVSIEDIRSGDKVINRYGQLEKVNFPTKIKYKGNGYNISTNAFNKDIKCTEGHKFLTTTMTDAYMNKEPKWVTAKEIHESLSMSNHSRKLLLYPLCKDFSGENVILKKEFDGAYKTVKHDWSVKQKICGDVVITPELMRLFGCFIGDGHISIGTKNERVGFSFNINEYEYYYHDFISKVEQQLGIKFCVSVKKEQHKVEISTGSIDVLNLFYYIFGDCNAKTKYIPNRLLHISYGLDCELLYGMILSDGCITKTIREGYESYRMTYTTISTQLRSDIRRLCNDLGIYTTESESFRYVDSKNVRHDKAYYISSSSKAWKGVSKRQHTSHETLVETIKGLYNFGNRKPRRTIQGQDYLLLKVKGMDLIEINEDVYCLNNNTHSFISEFAIAHNCITGWKYEDATEIWYRVAKHFGSSFFLEYQANNTEEQKKINSIIYELSKSAGIKTIIGLDTHYISEEDRVKRDNLLKRKGIRYPEEDGWYMDFPTGTEIFERMTEQGVIPPEEIIYAMMNTHVFNEGCEELEYNAGFKIPILEKYKGKSYEERSKILLDLLNEKYSEEDFEHRTEDRKEGMLYEYSEIDGSGTADYFLDNYELIDLAINKYKGQLTTTSRGSASSYYSSKLLGFTTMDRFDAEVPIYPERFVTKDRILSSHQMPDIDMNCATQEPFVLAGKELCGEHGCYPLLAVGRLKEKNGFKLYAGVNGIEPSVANEITKSIDRYNEALKNAEEEDRDLIEIEDYITDKYHLKLFNESKSYQEIIEQAKVHACGFMLFNGVEGEEDVPGYGDIRYEIGLIRCHSESTGKTTIVANIEGSLLDKYGYVKDDFLIVDVVGIIHKLYAAIGREVPSVTELRKMVTEDEKTWKMYEIGATCCLNQCEKASTTKKVMKFKPKNIKELAAFIAGIRPGFKSLINGFLDRVEYTNGEPAIDELLEDCFHYMLYQEAVMKIFSWLGIEMKDSYDTIKKISKKKLKGEALQHVEDTLREHWLKNIGNLDNFEPVYKVIKDSARYSFNAPHALAMANDSLYEAWMKANYTSVFYEVTLNHYQGKGDKNKVAELTREAMTVFGYKMGTYEYGKDNTKFTVDDKEKIIYPNLSSVKDIGDKAVECMMEISQSSRKDIIDIYAAIKGTKINSSVFRKLVKINYFRQYGSIKYILQCLDIYDKWIDRKTISKADVPQLGLDKINLSRYATDVTPKGNKSAKRWMIFNVIGLIRALCFNVPKEEFPSEFIAQFQYEVLGYIDYTDESLNDGYRTVCVMNLDMKYSPRFEAYCIKNGKVSEMKIHKKKNFRDKRCKTSFQDLEVKDGDIIYIKDCKKEPRRRKTDNGWEDIPDVYDWWIKDYSIIHRVAREAA